MRHRHRPSSQGQSTKPAQGKRPKKFHGLKSVAKSISRPYGEQVNVIGNGLKGVGKGIQGLFNSPLFMILAVGVGFMVINKATG